MLAIKSIDKYFSLQLMNAYSAMKLLLVLLATVFAAVFSANNAEKIRYDGLRLYRIAINSEAQLNAMLNLEATRADYIFVDSPVQVLTEINILVPPYKLEAFAGLMQLHAFNHELLHENFQELVDAEQPTRVPKAYGWTAYYSLAEIYSFLDDMVVAYPNAASKFEIGSSYEGRPTQGLKISYKDGNKAIFIEANIHAREWISSATATWTINALLSSSDVDIRRIAENYDWYFIPVANPDGYEYTRNVERVWRKTRTPQANGCFGVDPNRNFGYKWMEGGASDNPCSNNFAGPAPWSEVEVTNVADFYCTISRNVVIYLAFHSAGHYLLFPFGTSTDKVKDYDNLMQVGLAARDALRKRHDIVYSVGNSNEVLYPTSGISVDWAYGAAHAPLGYTYEFRDNGTYSHQLPPDQIIPNALEVMDSLVALVGEAEKLGYFNGGRD